MKKLRLKEKKFNYYDKYIENADIAIEMSRILKDYTENYDYKNSSDIKEKVHSLENTADQNMHEMLNFLAIDFLPPIEREDIVLLANKIDDLIDFLDEIAINFYILDVETLRDDFKDYIDIIDRLSALFKEILEKFKDKKGYDEINKFVIGINNIEEDGDRLFENSIKNLYRHENDFVEIIKWNKIYNTLENCIDSYENVANTIGEIVLKNA